MPARELLSIDEEAHIVDAIAAAERHTSGEIRVHIEFKCAGDPLKRAAKLFHKLHMDQTERRNGVLLYIATEDRKVAVFGDAGITDVVDDHFWQDEIDSLIRYFRDGKYEEGIAEVVTDIGKKLKQFFPSDKVDPNELDNSLSYRDNRDAVTPGTAGPDPEGTGSTGPDSAGTGMAESDSAETGNKRPGRNKPGGDGTERDSSDKTEREND